ncbi:hypothetical protein V6Z12_A10G075300 [Gossypium hirsutum]
MEVRTTMCGRYLHWGGSHVSLWMTMGPTNPSLPYFRNTLLTIFLDIQSCHHHSLLYSINSASTKLHFSPPNPTELKIKEFSFFFEKTIKLRLQSGFWKT